MHHQDQHSFLFWLAVLVAIWLVLVGLAHIVSGAFAPADIGRTIVIGATCAWGMIASFRARRSASLLPRVFAVTAFATLQVVAMWLSLRPCFVTG